MIIELGHFALVLALFVAAAQSIVPLVGAHKGLATWMAVARSGAFVQFILIASAFAALTYAFVSSDFSVANVISNSHTTKPLLYKISGVWGNHEGSMLLWVLILTIFGAAVAAFGGNLPPSLRARVLSVQALISVGFLVFIVVTSNPFERVLPPATDGRGLNPLLQDPGLAFHPPFLYLGYVGFSMAFSFAIAALIEGRVDAAWARWVRPWTLTAWIFLTIGIALGSWWAYYELGWGGWWYWDPVENASFMPWLAGTALLHSALVVEKRESLKVWTVFLAIVAFSFSLLGTFLVRSGVLTSVHAFATDPRRGVVILVLLLLVIGGSFALFAWRAPALRRGGTFHPVSREGGLLLNNLIMSIGAAVVLLGTLYPLMLDAVGGGKVSVGAPFFDATFVPLMIPMIVAMAAGPLLTWKRGNLKSALRILWVAFAAGILATLFAWGLSGMEVGLAPFGIGLAAWLFVGTLSEAWKKLRLFGSARETLWSRIRRVPRGSWGMTLTHGGLAIAIAGMTATTAWKQESIQVMKSGDSVAIAGYEFTFGGASAFDGPNYVATRGVFMVTKGGDTVVTLTPEKRVYTVEGRPTTEAAIFTTVWGDLYAVIGDRQGAEEGFVTRLYWNPLVVWMWAGAAFMVLGGCVSLSDRRFRVGVPTRRRIAAPAQAASA